MFEGIQPEIFVLRFAFAVLAALTWAPVVSAQTEWDVTTIEGATFATTCPILGDGSGRTLCLGFGCSTNEQMGVALVSDGVPMPLGEAVMTLTAGGQTYAPMFLRETGRVQAVVTFQGFVDSLLNEDLLASVQAGPVTTLRIQGDGAGGGRVDLTYSLGVAGAAQSIAQVQALCPVGIAPGRYVEDWTIRGRQIANEVCRGAPNATTDAFTLADGFVREDDFNGDGRLDTWLDYSKVTCTLNGGTFCDGDVCRVGVYISDPDAPTNPGGNQSYELFDDAVRYFEINGPFLTVGLPGPRCGFGADEGCRYRLGVNWEKVRTVPIGGLVPEVEPLTARPVDPAPAAPSPVASLPVASSGLLEYPEALTISPGADNEFGRWYSETDPATGRATAYMLEILSVEGDLTSSARIFGCMPGGPLIAGLVVSAQVQRTDNTTFSVTGDRYTAYFQYGSDLDGAVPTRLPDFAMTRTDDPDPNPGFLIYAGVPPVAALEPLFSVLSRGETAFTKLTGGPMTLQGQMRSAGFDAAIAPVLAVCPLAGEGDLAAVVPAPAPVAPAAFPAPEDIPAAAPRPAGSRDGNGNLIPGYWEDMTRPDLQIVRAVTVTVMEGSKDPGRVSLQIACDSNRGLSLLAGGTDGYLAGPTLTAFIQVDGVDLNRIDMTPLEGTPLYIGALDFYQHFGLIETLMAGNGGSIQIIGDDFYGEGALGLRGSRVALTNVATVCPAAAGQPQAAAPQPIAAEPNTGDAEILRYDGNIFAFPPFQQIQRFCDNDVRLGDGFLTYSDLDADGYDDIVLNYGEVTCKGSRAQYCGTAGCRTTILMNRRLVSTDPPGVLSYWNVVDDNVLRYQFVTDTQILVERSGSSCGKAGNDLCRNWYQYDVRTGRLTPEFSE